MYMKDDAASLLAYARGQAAIIERDVFSEARDMADIVYPQFVPVVGGNPFAEAITFVSTKTAGAADFINANADDVPLADSNMDVVTRPIYDAAIGYGWGWAELRRAAALGESLQADRAFAARRAYEEMVQRLAFDGDTRRGLVGLNGVTSQGTLVTAGFTGNWSAATVATAQEMTKDMITLIRGTGRGEQHTANRLVLPADELTHAMTTFFPNSSMTALDLIRQQYPGIQITGRTALQTAGASSKRKYLAYRYDQTSLAFNLPMPLQFQPVHQSGPLRFEVPGVFRVAGLNVKRKEDFAYALGA